jgi:hypothetical protein
MYEAFIAAAGRRAAPRRRAETLEMRDGRVLPPWRAANDTRPPPRLRGACRTASLALGRRAARRNGAARALREAARRTDSLRPALRTDLTFLFDIDRDLYFSLHSEVTPDLAPEGGQLLHAMAYLSEDDTGSDAALERRKSELLSGLDRFFPGWHDATVVERVLPKRA